MNRLQQKLFNAALGVGNLKLRLLMDEPPRNLRHSVTSLDAANRRVWRCSVCPVRLGL
jgi:hypothetical protein